MTAFRTVFSHFLQNSEPEPSAQFQSLNEMAIRMGRVVKVVYPEDEDNSNKKITEYTVDVYYSTDKDRTVVTYHHVKISSLFGGAADSLRWTPRLTTDDSEATDDDTFKSINLGSIVIVACIDGSQRSGLILGGWPHPNDNVDSPKDDGHNLRFQFNGLDVTINKDGELAISRLGPTKDNGKPIKKDDEAAGSKITMTKDGNIEIATPEAKQKILINHKDSTIEIVGDKHVTIKCDRVSVDSKNVELGGVDLTDYIAMAPAVKSEMKSQRDWAASHTHDSNDKFAGMGSIINLPSSPPSSGPPQVGDMGAKNVKGK